MREIYKGHEIDCHRAVSMGGWGNLYYSVFRMSDGYEVTSGFSSGNDKIRDYIGYMRERVDAYIADPAEEFPDETTDEINRHREEISKSIRGFRYNNAEANANS